MYHKKMYCHAHRFFCQEDGQAIVEYILLLAMAVAVVVSIKVSLKKVTGRLWSLMAKKIAAPCAECAAEDDFTI